MKFLILFFFVILALSVSAEETKADPTLCPICQEFMKFLEKELESPEVDKWLENEIEKFCSLVPPEQAIVCKGSVELYGPVVFKVLADNIAALRPCDKIGICDN
ncbi:saposin b domain-containing protein [Anaeramoeba flamelloides]|uniref:Saposin b domain-containing protein n=1 Tax=Anaeramoeba flamelloides TaxID=1746091 RepID=A0AAV8A0B7_9EUKA|nr:saposin b domain-containing protein [Anaeramoeba flamelloides]|eukprot:Anaeramoba_flamelloidesa581261_181.p1 GENE.a581261_181~~a581261_181.p1  ORF type:complete len:104 (+),score=20.98 a581261_181:18-329(+)